MQDAILTVFTCAWLGGLGTDSRPGELGRILDLEQVGAVFKGKQICFAAPPVQVVDGRSAYAFGSP